MDRYVNWIGREAKHAAFDGIEAPVVCEIGPGVGMNLAWYPPDARMVAIEPNVRMHDALRRRCSSHGVELEALHVGGAEDMPLPDGSVDEVVSSLVLCTVEDPDAVLAEVHRVLRPGGRFRFVEHIVATPGSLRRSVQRLLHRPWSWAFEGCQLDRDIPASLHKAGFADLDFQIGRFRHSVFFPVNRAVWGTALR
jgi:ubiquinone/menaquinone biosynthesis C-methylase UbiE